MSILRTAKGLTLSSYTVPGVPRLKAVNSLKIPLEQLSALYYFEEGTNGVVRNPPYDNVLGNATYDATIKLGASPTKRSYGHEHTDVDGIVYDSHVPWPVSGCVVMAVKHTVALGTQQYIHLAGPSSDDFPVTQGGNFSTGAPYPNIWVDSGGGQQDTIGLLDHAGTEFGSSVRPNIAVEKGPASSWNIVAFRWNNVLGLVDVCTLWRFRAATTYESVWLPNTTTSLSKGGLGWAGIQHANMVGYWTAIAGSGATVCFGLWPFGVLRPATGQVGLAAIISGWADDEYVRETALPLADIMIDRGFTPSGYPD